MRIVLVGELGWVEWLEVGWSVRMEVVMGLKVAWRVCEREERSRESETRKVKI